MAKKPRKILVTIHLNRVEEIVEIPEKITDISETYNYAKHVAEERFTELLLDGDAFGKLYPKASFTVMGDA